MTLTKADVLQSLDAFTRQYLITALWGSTNEAGVPLDKEFALCHFELEALEKAKADCAKFQEQAGDMILDDISRAGHDFWLTRNRHGAGFWDGDWPDNGDKLTELSHAFGEVNILESDDKTLFFA